MSRIGLVEYHWENLDGKNPNHEKRYVLPMFVPGSAEFFSMNHTVIEEHPEVTAFFERMTFLPLEKITPMVPPGEAGIGMHVIPVEKAIEMESKSISIEHISHWLKKYGKFAASPLLLPDEPGPHGRGLRRRPRGLVRGRGRHGRLRGGDRQGRPLRHL